MMGSRLTRLGLLSLLFSGLVACSTEEPPAPETQAAGTAPVESRLPEITPPAGFPAKVKNSDGRTALLPARPARILPGDASLLDALVELVEPERVAGLPRTAMTYSVLRAEPGPWAELEVLKSFEAEEILDREPDLLLVHAYQAGSTVDRVGERDVPVAILPIATDWKGTLASIRCLARLVDEAERGEAFVERLETRRRILQAEAPRTGMRVMPYGNYGAGGTTAGRGTTWQTMIELAGMRNAAAEAGMEGHPEVDFEQLLAIDPDFFLVAEPEGVEIGSGETLLRKEPLLRSLRAVKEERFLRLPEYLYSTASHQVLTAAEAIAEQADAALAAR